MVNAETGEKFMWGEVLSAEPYARLVYTFAITPMGEQVSKVTWTLNEVEGGTLLSLKHQGLPQGVQAFGLLLALDKGWDEHLARLRDTSNIA